MAYQQGVVASIFINNKPVREFNFKGQRTCKIPFGSEYQIFIKNRTSSRGYVSIDIDGTDVLGFKQLVMKPHDEIMLERFVDDLDRGKKFRFISLEEGMRTGEIQDPTNEDNGLITVTFYKEIIEPPTTIHVTGTKITQCQVGGASLTSDTVLRAYTGATVEGANSSQNFSLTEEVFPTECTPIELSIKLIGIPLRERFGIFIDNNKKPSYEFKDRMEAFRFLEANDFGHQKTKIKEL